MEEEKSTMSKVMDIQQKTVNLIGDLNKSTGKAIEGAYDSIEKVVELTQNQAESQKKEIATLNRHVRDLNSKFLVVAIGILLILMADDIGRGMNSLYRALWLNQGIGMRTTIVAGVFLLVGVIINYPVKRLWKKLYKDDSKD